MLSVTVFTPPIVQLICGGVNVASVDGFELAPKLQLYVSVLGPVFGVVLLPTNVCGVFSQTTVGLVVIDAVGAIFTVTVPVCVTVAQLGVLMLKVTVFTPEVLQLTVWAPSVLAVDGLEPLPKSHV